MAIEQAYLLKGFVLAHNPPAEILQAVDAVIAALSVHVTGAVAVEVPAVIAIPVPDAELSEPKAEATATVEPPSKTRKPWSPEARAAAAERMRTRQAAKKAGSVAPGEAYAPSLGGA